MTGIVRGYEITTNRDSLQQSLLLQVEVSGSNDIQTVEYMSNPGDDTLPPVGSIVTILSAGRAWKIAVACNDRKDFTSGLNEGEKHLYSIDSGTIKSFIKLLNSGNIELNGNANDAVSYAALNTALQGLITAINAAFATKLDGGGTTGTLTLDISGSQVTTVKLP